MSAPLAEVAAPSPRGRIPWSTVLRAPILCTSIQPIVLATLGVLAFWIGANGLARAFALTNDATGVSLWRAATELSESSVATTWAAPSSYLETVVEPAWIVIRPFLAFFSVTRSAQERVHGLLLGLWLLVTWSVCGAAISRSVIVRLTRGTGLGVVSSLGYAVARLPTLLGPPLAPLLLASVLSIPAVLVGLIGRLPGPLGSFAKIFGLIPLLFGLAMATILLGLAIGWPLIATSIASEGEDGFDALSRTYSYVNRRPILYLLLLIAATVGGFLGLVAAKIFVEVTFGLASWGLYLSHPSPGEILTPWRPAGSVILLAWSYSHFWTALSLIYLRLRFDIDGTLPDEIAEDETETLSTPFFAKPQIDPATETQ